MVEKQQSQIFLLTSEFKRLKGNAKLWKEELKAISAKGSFSQVAATVSKASRNGHLVAKESILDIMKTISKKRNKKKSRTSFYRDGQF